LEQLAKIKTEPKIEPTFTAKDTAIELIKCNDGKEFKNLDQLKDFIIEKKEILRRKFIK